MAYDDLFDATGLTIEAAALMEEVQILRRDINVVNTVIPWGYVADVAVNLHPSIQRGRCDLYDRAVELRGRCERSISWKREVMDREAFDEFMPFDPEESRSSRMEFLAAQIEAVEYALVRVNTALDMLQCMP